MDAPEPRSGAGKIATMSCLGNMPAKIAAALALATCLAGACNADTIVLKNGRRIVVSNVTARRGKGQRGHAGGAGEFAGFDGCARGKGRRRRRSRNDDESRGGRSAHCSAPGGCGKRFRSSRSSGGARRRNRSGGVSAFRQRGVQRDRLGGCPRSGSGVGGEPVRIQPRQHRTSPGPR